MDIINEREEHAAIRIAATLLVERVVDALARQQRCALGIVGGRSMPALLETVVKNAHRLRGKGRIEVFWLDERVSPDKNYIPALRYLERLSMAGLDIAWHPLQSATVAAIEVEARQTIAALTALQGKQAFDVIIVSSGEDGHVAGLFPRHDALKAKQQGYTLVKDAPKPPPDRISVTPSLLQSAKAAIILFIGEKQAAYDAFLDPKTAIAECPAKLLQAIPALDVITCLKR